MRVKVRTMFDKGRALPQQERYSHPAHVGVLNISEHRDPELGRALVRARLLDAKGNEVEILPELNDARILWLEGSKLRLSGMERIDKAAYAQTWSVEVA